VKRDDLEGQYIQYGLVIVRYNPYLNCIKLTGSKRDLYIIFLMWSDCFDFKIERK